LYALSESSVQLFALPLFHIGGLLIAALAVAAGASTVVMADADPEQMVRLAQRHRITHLPAVPVLLKAFIDRLKMPEHRDADLADLRTVLYGASAMPAPVLRAAMARLGPVRYLGGYGMTETCATMTFLPPEEHDLVDERAVARLASVGRPSTEVQMRVVDPGTLAELPPGGTGEVLVRGSQVMLGYWRRPEETGRALLAGVWFRTGDGGYFDDDGYLYLTDRIKDMINTGGENVYPVEVEHVLLTLPGVREVAVIGVPDARWGETPRAVVVREPGAELIDGDVIRYCRGRLAGYKCPTSVTWVPELPRTPSGKVMKHLLRTRYG
jgi:acyl-CoA synthetase (AMP-forming)/AMP-acid ligase II